MYLVVIHLNFLHSTWKKPLNGFIVMKHTYLDTIELIILFFTPSSNTTVPISPQSQKCRHYA